MIRCTECNGTFIFGTRIECNCYFCGGVYCDGCLNNINFFLPDNVYIPNNNNYYVCNECFEYLTLEYFEKLSILIDEYLVKIDRFLMMGKQIVNR